MRIVKDYNEYVMRNLTRGYTRKDLNVSYVKVCCIVVTKWFDTSISDFSASRVIIVRASGVTYISCLFVFIGETATSRHGYQEVTSKGEGATGACGAKGASYMKAYSVISLKTKN